MLIRHIAGYKFITLNALEDLQKALFTRCDALALRGTILLSPEGINVSLAGTEAAIKAWRQTFSEDARFADISFHQTMMTQLPFKRLKVKIKKEIIAFRQPIEMSERAPSITPAILKQWLDEKRAVTLLDTRNHYEIEHGSFQNAVNLMLNDFCELPKKTQDLPTDKPIVMFCTGGIRCEKAAKYLQAQGLTNVYQLDGGIIAYFAQTSGEHYQGDCFVFDERVAIGKDLKPVAQS